MRLPMSFDGFLSSSERDILDSACETLRFAPGDRIFRAGDPGDGFYIIEQGDVRLEISDFEHVDSEYVLGYLTAGCLLGEMSILDGMPRSASAFAETDVIARRLTSAKWDGLGNSHPQVVIALLRALGRDVSLKLRNANERLAEQLPDLDDASDIGETVARAAAAQREFERWDEERVDAVLLALSRAIADSAERLARATVDETRIGNVADKTLKNLHASLGIYRSLAGKPGIGVIRSDRESSVTNIAAPAGVVFGIVPVTNPVATAVFKALISLKARCAIILSFHRRCLGVGNAACEIVQRVLTEHGVPDHLVQWIRQRSSRSKTVQFMRHPGVSLILATGGAGMVKAAYSSGTPAIGVGPGNAPVYIAADADPDAAAAAIVSSKPFDNGLVCGAEQNLVVDTYVHEALVAALERHGAAILNAAEIRRLRSSALHPSGRVLGRTIIGQPAQAIAAAAQIERHYPIKLIVLPLGTDEVGLRTPFAREKLAPMLSLFAVDGEVNALALCRDILAIEGAGHTAVIHTGSPDRAERFGLAMPASRILVNAPAVQGICGNATGLVPSYVLGCGTFGRTSTTENVSYTNLQNIKRLARVVEKRTDLVQPPHPGP
jgi:acyl-CoA reductase-like NAD-dependent aldehyde dehydrogenase